MKNNKRYLKKYLKLSVGTLALATGTLAISLPADAQRGQGRQRGALQAETTQAPTVFDEQAKSILAKSAERYKNLQTWQVEQEVINGERLTKKVVAQFRAPQSLVVTTTEAKGIKTAVYYEPEKVTTLREFDNLVEYQTNEANHNAPGQNSRLHLGNALGQYLTGFFLGSDNPFGRLAAETVTYVGQADVNGIPVDNIRVTAQVRNQPVAITYSIGKQDSLLHKVVQSPLSADGTPALNPNGTSADYVETYSGQTTDASLPASNFQFTPPAGAKEVERFTRSRGLALEVGDSPFAINAKDIDGQEISLEQYKGKVVLLDFWATWCGPCRAELPHLKAAYNKYKEQGFDVLGVSIDQTIEPLKQFVAKDGIGWRNVYDGYWNGPIANAYNVRFIPTTILIGRDGKIAALNARGASLDSAIEKALANS